MTTVQFSERLLDDLIGEAKTSEDVFGPDGLLRTLQKALLNRMLDAEMTHTLGYARQESKPEGQENYRNGAYAKTVKTAQGSVEVQVPRDRQGQHEPKIVPKGVRRLPGFDAKVLSLYARGMTLSEIQGHLEELYQVEISKDLLSTVTDAVLDEVKTWAARPLKALYPIVYIDALFFNVRQEGRVLRKAVHLVLGVDEDGKRDVLGLWINETEGAKFWLSVMNDLKNRGVKRLLFVCADGLTGLPEAIRAVFPQAAVQLCVVHLLRNAFNYAAWNHRKEIAKDLRPVYTAHNEEEARKALDSFKEKWDAKYPNIGKLFERHWTNFIPFLQFPHDVRKTLYTTNAIESLHSKLRKITDNKRIFPNDDAVRKVLYLALQNIQKKWTMPIRDWKLTLAQLQILYPDAFHTQSS